MKTSFTTVSLKATRSDWALVMLWYEYLAQSVGKLWVTAHIQTQIYWLTSRKHNDGKNACDLSWWNSCLEGVVLNFDHHGCWQMHVLEGISTWVIFPQAWFDPPSFTSRAQSGSSVPTDTVSPPSGSSVALQLIPTSVSDSCLRMRPSRSAEYSWITWWWRNEDTSDD